MSTYPLYPGSPYLRCALDYKSLTKLPCLPLASRESDPRYAWTIRAQKNAPAALGHLAFIHIHVAMSCSSSNNIVMHLTVLHYSLSRLRLGFIAMQVYLTSRLQVLIIQWCLLLSPTGA